MKSYQCDFSPTVVRFQPSKELVVLVTGDPIAEDANEKGCVNILDFSESEPRITKSFNTEYQVCDSTWSRTIPDHFVLAGGNGFFYVFNPFIPNIDPNVNSNSIFSFHAHDGSVSCVDWNPSKDSFITGSTDGTVKLWTLDESNYREDGTYPHPEPVHSAKWNPANPEIFATISAGGRLRIWDRRVMDRPDASSVECDSNKAQFLDWNRTGRFIAVSTPTRYLFKVWDTTDLRKPVHVFWGYNNARFLPHLNGGMLVSSAGGWAVIRNYDRRDECNRINFRIDHSPVKSLDINQIFQSWFASAGRDRVVNLKQYMQPGASSAQGSAASEPENDGGPSDSSERRSSSTQDRPSCCSCF